MNTHRLERLRKNLKEHKLDAMLVRFPSNLRYISGYSGSNGMSCITRDAAWFFTDFRYKEQSKQEVANMHIVVPENGDLLRAMQGSGCVKSGMNVGFEGNRLAYDEFSKLEILFPDVLLVNASMLMEKIASVKEKAELDALKEAARISDAAFDALLDKIRPGISERRLDAELSYIMKSLGSEKDSFDTIVASGINGAKPHHKPEDKLLQKGEYVTLDFGAMYGGYHADITRTVCLGKANGKQREIYDIVLQSQLLALQSIRAGKTGKAIDAIARDYISEKGYGEYFGHGLGHGIGLEVHAEPRLSPKYEEILECDQVVTVEPGIYIPDWGGVRIEDNVVITKDGCVNLTTAPKTLIEL
ncbi:MAG: aminopeptidase P family protein [FCB group bacterium]|nr:aminopeptidase P family protein [FCB group bacterium]